MEEELYYNSQAIKVYKAFIQGWEARTLKSNDRAEVKEESWDEIVNKYSSMRPKSLHFEHLKHYLKENYHSPKAK